MRCAFSGLGPSATAPVRAPLRWYVGQSARAFGAKELAASAAAAAQSAGRGRGTSLVCHKAAGPRARHSPVVPQAGGPAGRRGSAVDAAPLLLGAPARGLLAFVLGTLRPAALAGLVVAVGDALLGVAPGGAVRSRTRLWSAVLGVAGHGASC